jgi:hypothetical protein
LSRVRSEIAAAPELQRVSVVDLLARHERAVALLASALLVFVAQFHRAAGFGLYEDDYFFISRAMGQDLPYLVDRLSVFVTLPQGRPFGFFLPDLLSFVGDKLGGLGAIYVLGFCVVTLNTFLCYCLLRARVPIVAAAVGAAMFCLFPADTTKILLTHDFQLQPALTFALLSALAYVAGRRWIAYPLAAGALLSYENAFLALFALPLFLRRWDRAVLRELARHVLLLAAVLAAVVIARLLAGEVRATQSTGGVAEIVPKLVGSLVLGPAYAVAASLYQPLRMVPTWDLETLVLALVAGLLFGLLVWRLRLPPSPWRDIAETGGAGLVMLVLAYGLAFTHYPPSAVIGRGTSVHLGATLGIAVLAAAVVWALMNLRPALAAVAVGAYLTLAVGYYMTIERDFVRSWQLQRAFWQQVAACCSDLQDGTVVIYELPPTVPTTFIFTNSWADPLVLDQTFRFPAAWATPPRLFALTEWQPRVAATADGLQWWVPGASWDEHWEALPQDNVILLRPGPGDRLERLTGEVPVAGQVLRLKDPGPPVAWPPAQLAPLLLR